MMFDFELFPADDEAHGGLQSDGVLYFYYFYDGKCRVFHD
jgi:hypothetical protein